MGRTHVDKRVSNVAVSVILAQHSLRFHIFTLGDEPSRTLGAEPACVVEVAENVSSRQCRGADSCCSPNQRALQQRRQCLEYRRDSPRPRTTFHSESTESRPLNTNVPVSASRPESGTPWGGKSNRGKLTAAMILPTYQLVLYIAVMGPR